MPVRFDFLKVWAFDMIITLKNENDAIGGILTELKISLFENILFAVRLFYENPYLLWKYPGKKIYCYITFVNKNSPTMLNTFTYLLTLWQ